MQNGEVRLLRQQAGKWLQELRIAAGLSQRDMAKAIGISFYTFVSQVEGGRARVPPAQMRPWAEALKVPTRDFALNLMRFYDHLNYELIFGEGIPENGVTEAGGTEPEQVHPDDIGSLSQLEARISKLEAKINKLERRNGRRR